MSELTINCPKCGAQIELTEAVAGPALAEMRSKLTREAEERARALDLREADVKKRTEAVEKTVQERLSQARKEVEREAQEGAAKQVAEMQATLRKNEEKLAEAQKAQADAVKLQRELENKKRELDLEVERRVTAQAGETRAQVQREMGEQYRLQIADKDRALQQVQADLEEARQRAAQGSQKEQGEVLEADFEGALRRAFPQDEIVAVPDRVGQGDLHQRVSTMGQTRGLVVWELKRTKNWGADWLPKLRGIQRELRAEAAVVCSMVLPEGVETFGCVDGVWVCGPRYALALAQVLRLWLEDVHVARQSAKGQKGKMELLYGYLTGQNFKHRLEAVVENFTEMREDLDRERRLMTKQWAKRTEQLDVVLEAVAGLYGDLQGIARAELPVVAGLELPAGKV